MKKRILSFILAICMLLPMLPTISVSAEETGIEVIVRCNGGRWTYENVLDGTSGGGAGHGFQLEPGQCLEDIGIKMTSLTYWTDRAFLGWEALTREAVYDQDGYLMYYEWVRLEGTELMTSEEMLRFKIPEGVEQMEFQAAWEGNDDDYYTFVDIHPFVDTTFSFTTQRYDNVNTYTYEQYGGRFEENGKTIKENLYIIDFQDPVWEGHELEGWVMTYWGNNGLAFYSETVYSTEEMLNMVIPHDDVTFYAKWDTIDIDDMAAIHDGYGLGEYSFFPEDAQITNMVLEEKYPLNEDGLKCFAFEVPTDGTYRICADGFFHSYCNVSGGFQYISPYSPASYYLTKGQTVKFYVEDSVEANVWLEQTTTVTSMEVVSQNKDRKVLGYSELYGGALLQDIVLEVTYSDGTKRQFDMNEWGEFLDDRELAINYQRGKDAVTVTLSCGLAQVSYQIPTTKATVTKFEVIPNEDFVLYEGIDGNEENGVFYYDTHKVRYYSTFRFTWSDGTVDTVSANDLHNGYCYYGSWISGTDNQWENPWSVGTNTMMFMFAGLSCTVDVVVAENPIKNIASIEYDAVLKQCYYGDPYYYYYPDNDACFLNHVFNDADVFTIHYKDGTSKSYTYAECIEQYFEINGISMGFFYAEEDQAYAPEGTVTIVVEYGTLETTFDIEVLPASKLAGKNGWFEINGLWAYLEDGAFTTNKWIRQGSNWLYITSSGRMAADTFVKIDGQYYHFNKNGYMTTGWQQYEGLWYYLGSNGAMKTGWQQIGGKWYYLKNEMKTGWQQIEGKWYYFGSDGAMKTGWQQIGGKWYYLKNEMKTGWQSIGGKWYYLGSDGAMKTGWQSIGGKWYYLNSEMKTGWQKIGGSWYYLGSNGAMRTSWQKVGSSWYYLGSDGAMRTGWLKLGSSWYYLGSDGAMRTGTVVIGGKTYIFDSNGVWIG